MRDHFGVGFAAEFGAVFAEPLAQFAKILDDAVVHDRDGRGRVRMRVALARLAVRGPARVSDPDIAGQRLLGEPRLQRLELALSSAARELAVVERGDTGGVIAAVFEALERIDQVGRDRFAPENSNDTAHWAAGPPFDPGLAAAVNDLEIKTHCAV